MAILNNSNFNILSILLGSGYNLQITSNNLLRQFSIGNMNIPQMELLYNPLGRPMPAVTLKKELKVDLPKQSGVTNQIAGAGINALSSLLGLWTSNMFGDSEIELNLANVFSSGVSSATNTISDNIIKGNSLLEGLDLNVGESVKGTALGIGANLVGKGINALGGDSKLSRGLGQGVATGIANAKEIFNGIKSLTNTGKAIKEANTALNLAKNTKNAGDMAKALNVLNGLKGLKGAQIANLAGIGGQVIGSALGAAMGPSKEYGGKYGGITQGMDTAYDLILTGIGFVPGWGTIASGAMALNKGLSNIFGSTDGMTKLDAILGSAFMPAPVKWLNMWGSSKTGTFNNQSWLNSEKANSFMGNAFGNLSDRFDLAREEAGKTYGTFSRGARNRALSNINFANQAWDLVLAMADLNEILKIRSQYMSSINNQRYAQEIGGVWQPLVRGKYGMKILNNATNHNIGQRLLSGAALIDNKQMILCNVLD